MSVDWIRTVTPWENATPSTSGAFTPTAGDTLITYGMDGSSATASLVFSGSEAGSWSELNPPGNYGDTSGDTHGLGVNLSCAAGSQTVTVTSAGSTFLLGFAWEYSGVGSVSSVSGVQRNAPGTGAGAITGTSVTVPTGAVLLATCIDITGTPTISSPSGTNRGSGSNDGIMYCATEYAGAGSPITPTFTTTGGSDNYVVLQVLLSPPATTQHLPLSFFAKAPVLIEEPVLIQGGPQPSLHQFRNFSVISNPIAVMLAPVYRPLYN
jgi:hypothetical protein